MNYLYIKSFFPSQPDSPHNEVGDKFDNLNTVAGESEYLPKIKLNDLEQDTNYIVTKIKKINTKYGMKVVLELREEWQFFVPKRVNDMIIHDDELYEFMCEHVQKMQLHMRYISTSGGLKFLR